MAGELLEFQNGTMGQVFNLEEDSIGVVIFGDYLEIKEGDTVKPHRPHARCPVGDAVIGRVVNPLGQPIDGGPDRDQPRTARSRTSRPRHRRASAGQASRCRPASRRSTA